MPMLVSSLTHVVEEFIKVRAVLVLHSTPRLDVVSWLYTMIATMLLEALR